VAIPILTPMNDFMLFDVAFSGKNLAIILIKILLFFLCTMIVCFMEGCFRIISVYGNVKTADAKSKISNIDVASYVPMKFNVSSFMPVFFVSILLMMPETLFSFFGSKDYKTGLLKPIFEFFATNPYFFFIIKGLLIVFFCFVYATINFNCYEIANNLSKNNLYIHGTRPGLHTEYVLYQILNRITLIGGIYLALLCIIPEYMPKYFLESCGTSLLIVVSVALDIINNIKIFDYQKNYNISAELVVYDPKEN
jgi:preprotein translocase subunit SecY